MSNILCGIPYMGSKTKIAIDILKQLPKGKRFVDLCGGGFAMSHCAYLSRKYDTVYYNDFNPAIVELVKGGYEGLYNYKRFKPEFITREMFTELKEKDPYVKYIWSFGNTGKTYMFGKDVEPIKHIAHDFVVFGKWNDELNKVLPNVRSKVKANTIHQRRIEFCGYARQLNKRTDLQRLEQLQRLETITFNCGSLFNFQYQEGDVVYIDPPYESEADYDGGFDFQKFYDWVYSQPYQVWFSGYKISDKRFKMVWARELRSSYGIGNKAVNFECLYTNK